MSKLDLLKKIATGISTGATLGAALLSQDEANAAGISTIARKLGIGLEEAAKIKQMAASNVPQSLWDENIKAIQAISGYKKTPELYPKIGAGVDFRALQTPEGKVLKVPKDLTENESVYQIAPSLVEQAGLGPKTKTMQVADRPYMLQDKVTPLENIKVKPKGDPNISNIIKKMEILTDEANLLDRNDPKYKNKIFELEELQSRINRINREYAKTQGIDIDKLTSQYNRDIKNEMKRRRYEMAGISSPQDIIDQPKAAFEAQLNINAQNKMGDYIMPQDLHDANIGIDINKNPTIFDTSRFKYPKVEKFTPEMKQKIMESNIALPEKKKALQQLLNVSPNDSQTQLINFDDVLKAAAVGAVPISSPNQELLSKPATQLADLYHQFVQKPAQSVGENIADIVRPPINLTEEQKQTERNIAGSLTGMALDPLNIINPAIGIPAQLGADYMATPETEEQRQKRNAIDRLR